MRATYLLPLHLTYIADIQKAQKNDFEVIVWTVNKKEDIVTCLKKGFDGVASDKPDTLRTE